MPVSPEIAVWPATEAGFVVLCPAYGYTYTDPSGCWRPPRVKYARDRYVVRPRWRWPEPFHLIEEHLFGGDVADAEAAQAVVAQIMRSHQRCGVCNEHMCALCANRHYRCRNRNQPRGAERLLRGSLKA